MRAPRLLLLSAVTVGLAFVLAGPLTRAVLDRGAPGLAERRETVDASSPDRPDVEADVHLKVLNGVGVTNLASDISLLLHKVGCVAQTIGNAETGPYPASLLVNRRLPPARAEALAADLGEILLIAELDEATEEDAVLVLGDDYARVLDRLSGAPD